MEQSRRMAAEQAWEDGMDAPAIAAAFSAALPYLASMRQAATLGTAGTLHALPGLAVEEQALSTLQRAVSLLPEEAVSLKAAEAEDGWAAWRAETRRVLLLALPLAVGAALRCLLACRATERLFYSLLARRVAWWGGQGWWR